MVDFAKLKSMSSKNTLENLNKELAKFKSGSEKKGPDNRFWTPTTDKSGNGYAIIRFLPAPDGEDAPFIRYFDHGFQGSGGWYIENSLTTFDQPDFATEYNSKLWNSGIESNKELARKQKRRMHFFSNIYVVSDPAKPENEGKVFLYKYGKKIFDKINSAMNPEFPDDDKIDPFHLWEGANFRLKIRKVDGYPNYEKSEFERPSALHDDDSKLEKVYNSEYSLQEFLSPTNFKSYEDLKARFLRAIGETASKVNSVVAASIEDEDDAPVKFKAKSPPKQAAVVVDEDEDEDEEMKFFNKLAR